jgi:hypothetical protein
VRLAGYVAGMGEEENKTGFLWEIQKESNN